MEADTVPREHRPVGPWPELDVPHVLWFFGAIVAAGASLAILDRVPESHRDLWEFLAALGFFAAYVAASALLSRRASRTPAGLAAFVAVTIVPAAGYGLTRLVDVYPREAFFDPFESFSGAVFGITMATLAAALLAWGLTRLSFLFLTAAGALQLAGQLLATSLQPSGDGRAAVAILVGGALVVLGLIFDMGRRHREAFWLYVGGFGGAAVALAWFALTSGGSQHRGWLPMAIAGGAVLFLAGIVRRRVWATFGAAGVAAGLIHYLQKHPHWFPYFLLGLSLLAFATGLALRSRRRDARGYERDRTVTETPPSTV